MLKAPCLNPRPVRKNPISYILNKRTDVANIGQINPNKMARPNNTLCFGISK